MIENARARTVRAPARPACRSFRKLSRIIGYDFEIYSDSTTLGPLAEFGVSVPVGDINVFNGSFALNFGQEQVFGVA